MKTKNPAARATAAVDAALVAQRRDAYVLRLYVAGATDRSRKAVLRARELCKTELSGRYELEVIDIYQQPILARDGQILATPTLVREFPKPVRRLIGDMANTTGLLLGLDVNTKGKART